jgi:hypothetical protein
MASTAVRVAVGLLLTLGCLSRAAAACSCANGGSIVQRSPCECRCTDAYAQPNCEWRNDALLEVVIVFSNTTSARFSTRAKAEAILDHYQPVYTSSDPLPYKVLRRRTASEPPDGSEVHVVFRVRGDLVNALLVDAAAGPAQWMQDIGILRIFRYVLSPSEPGSLAGSPTVFSFAVMNNTVPVPFGAIAWPMGGLIALILIPLSEAILSGLCFNAGDMAEEDAYPDGVAPSPAHAAVSKEESGYY